MFDHRTLDLLIRHDSIVEKRWRVAVAANEARRRKVNITQSILEAMASIRFWWSDRRDSEVRRRIRNLVNTIRILGDQLK